MQAVEIEQTISTGSKGPEKKIRAGAVTATIWKNSSEKGDYFTVSIERNYKDANDQWKSTNSFRASDLPKVRLVTDKAFEFLTLKETE